MCKSNEQFVHEPVPPAHPDDKLWFQVISHQHNLVDQERSKVVIQESHVHPLVITISKLSGKRFWSMRKEVQQALCGMKFPPAVVEQVIRPDEMGSIDTMTMASTFESAEIALEVAERDNAYFKASEDAELMRIASIYNRDDDKYGPVMILGDLRQIED